MNDNIVLSVRDLEVNFYNNERCNRVLRGVSFQLQKGKIMCIVGESGCGKSVTANSIMGLLPDLSRIENGEIHFFHNGRDIRIDQLKRKGKEMRQIRGDGISMIFQDSMTSLNPVLTIGRQLEETISVHSSLSKDEIKKQALDILTKVGVSSPEQRLKEFPHQLSGGMRQRVMIAMALSCSPSLLIADEPTTALDVTIQAQIIDLMVELKKNINASIILITHDMGVVAEMADYIMVMYAGKVMEYGSARQIFKEAMHPYTQGLLASIPRLDKDLDRLFSIDGTVPSLDRMPKGCRFCARCLQAMDKCREHQPPVYITDDGHKVSCWKYENLKEEKV